MDVKVKQKNQFFINFILSRYHLILFLVLVWDDMFIYLMCMKQGKIIPKYTNTFIESQGFIHFYWLFYHWWLAFILNFYKNLSYPN